ncbi:TetR/AcrR family transcriptional regulator [Nocardia asteroides]|uniref:TetR/AcrR family transcriptional regulator n=1 Tax=Nocardia asteroides TaxID=1824 RepID=UPI001E2D754E|nr:TetR/AcrR family transcriptional regulator [Nocardia asteroides]UGT57645.1 TetR/AcrR family transcriptional regulator [Nocardia asteroides]
MPTTVELLWGTAQRPTRGPKPALTLDGIVASAIALADAEGLAGLSMQRLAQGLGFTKMSLYRYVPGKEQLTALMLDTAMGTPPEPGGKGWRADLRAWVEAIFARYRTHPWTIELTLGLRPIGPNELSWTEAALAATEGTGLTGPERLDTIVLLNGHARSLAQQVDSVGDSANDQVVEQFTAMMSAAGDRFPAVSAAFAEEAASTSGGNDAFDFGVERILDGLAVLIERRGLVSGLRTP